MSMIKRSTTKQKPTVVAEKKEGYKTKCSVCGKSFEDYPANIDCKKTGCPFRGNYKK